MLHPKNIWNGITLGITIIVLLIYAIAPVWLEDFTVEIVVASILLIGIPHGAIDHVIALTMREQVYGATADSKFWLQFYSFYLSSILLIGLIWTAWAPGGLMVFLAMTAYHWGQADMEKEAHLELPYSLVYMVRGTLVVALIMLPHPEQINGIVKVMIGQRLTEYALFSTYANTAIAAIIAGYFVIMLPALNKVGKKKLLAFLFDSALLVALFMIANTLIAFAIYFAFWHSIGHVEEMIQFQNRYGSPINWGIFYKQSVPFTLLSLLGIGLIYVLYILFDLNFHWLPMTFIVISALTLPHLLLVDRMYKLLNKS